MIESLGIPRGSKNRHDRGPRDTKRGLIGALGIPRGSKKGMIGILDFRHSIKRMMGHLLVISVPSGFKGYSDSRKLSWRSNKKRPFVRENP